MKRQRLYIAKNCRVIKGERYERLYDHPQGEKYRVFHSDDDYDYVVCGFLIRLLDVYFKHTRR